MTTTSPTQPGRPANPFRMEWGKAFNAFRKLMADKEDTAQVFEIMRALNGRAIKVDESGKVLSYKMTSQCASGSGQFLENIARYLGIAQDEIGTLSKQADNPEKVSGICAVLAETDVINMVSRGITAPNILKGIHESMADRLAKLLKTSWERS